MKAGVEVCCINALYSKSHVGGPRSLAAEPCVPRRDNESLKIVCCGKVAPGEAFVDVSVVSK